MQMQNFSICDVDHNSVSFIDMEQSCGAAEAESQYQHIFWALTDNMTLLFNILACKAEGNMNYFKACDFIFKK